MEPTEKGFVTGGGRGLLVHRWEYEGGQILAFAVPLDGRVLASAGNDDIIRIWETSTGTELA